MKLFSSKQVSGIDSYTIKHEPIASVDLMERASMALCNEFTCLFQPERRVLFFIGPGNNGGDGLALARMLDGKGYPCFVFIARVSEKLSADSEINLKRLLAHKKVKVSDIRGTGDFPVISGNDVVVDALFGSGLTRPVEGLGAELIKHINRGAAPVFSIDIPSGMFGEDNTGNINGHIIKADFTCSFQFPKISFMFAENEAFTGSWKVLPIGLHETAISRTESNYYYITSGMVAEKIPVRKKFSHKGTFGHALLIAGSYGKTGAAVLAAGSCLRAGTGLLTVHLPLCGNQVMQVAVPEAMVSPDVSNKFISGLPGPGHYTAVGAGPGIGTKKQTKEVLRKLLMKAEAPVVLDADALNILAGSKSLLKLLPENTILTPHPGEFDRLAGKSSCGWDRHLVQIKFALKYKVVVVLKGAYTSIALPDGRCFFNPTGNPGMATAGSGDVLTGIILSLLAQGYSPADASITGVYLHGLAGDIAKEKNGEESLIAGDIIANLGNAFNRVRNVNKDHNGPIGK